MKLALERGVLFKDGREVATYDAATETVHSGKRLGRIFQEAAAEAVGGEPRFTFGKAGSGDPAVRGKSGEARRGAASPDDPEPVRHPALGDRTPAWAEWLRRRDPEAFAERYQIHSRFSRI